MTNDKQNEFYQILNKARTNKLWTTFSGHLVSGRLIQGRIWKCLRQWIFWYWRKCFDWIKMFYWWLWWPLFSPSIKRAFQAWASAPPFPQRRVQPALLKGIKPKAPASKGQSLTQGTSWPKPVRRPSRQNPNRDSVLINFWPFASFLPPITPLQCNEIT